ncbi:MAG: Mov34/MPN/PAD-1 family protein [Isosphaeraceae bacterium]|nr:Mov34/MPN/PAD-1 family protein [Isosphaeraceae bacterium]
MSTDDIVFEGDVTYREPQRLRRPDRDRRYTCIAYEVPGPDDLPIFLDRKPADAIERHALRDTSVELGGILLGKECVDDETGTAFVWITESLEAKHYENTQASFTYTHDSWEEITRERDRQFPDLDIVGWYHTHPTFGIFLSSHDLFIHHHFFAQPLQVAYVVDPVNQTRGFFQWRGGQMAQVGGFYLVAERQDRLALARLVNDLEDIPNPDGGGGLSPRLEAELIHMLTRPQQPMAVATPPQTAILFSLIGVLTGVLLVAAVLWLQSMSANLQAHTEELKALEKSLAVKAKESELDLERERVRAKEQALDALIGQARLGGRTEDYAKVVMERDEARKKLEERTVAFNVLGEDVARLKKARDSLAGELAAEQKKRQEIEKESEAKLDKQLDENERQKAQIDELQAILRDSGAGLLAKKYKYAWYAAVIGWALAVAAGLGLVAALARNLPTEPEPAAPQGEEPPHRIS